MADDDSMDYFDDVDENFEQEVLGEGTLFKKILQHLRIIVFMHKRVKLRGH